MTVTKVPSELNPDSTGWRRYLPPTPWFTVITLAAAVALGLCGGLSDRLAWWIGMLGNLIALWLFVSFIAGAAGRGLWAGAARGAVALLATVVPHHVLHAGADVGSGHMLSIGTIWVVAAIPAGVLFGFLGALWRRGRTDFTAGAVGVLCAGLAGEGIYAMVEVWAPAIRLMLALEPLLAVWLPLVLLQSWRRRGIAYGITAIGVASSLAGSLLATALI